MLSLSSIQLTTKILDDFYLQVSDSLQGHVLKTLKFNTFLGGQGKILWSDMISYEDKSFNEIDVKSIHL